MLHGFILVLGCTTSAWADISPQMAAWILLLLTTFVVVKLAAIGVPEEWRLESRDVQHQELR